jgi:uncharacterized protein (DUF2141 family)
MRRAFAALALAALGLAAMAGAAAAARLTVMIEGLRSGEGQVMAALFSRGENFPDGDYADLWAKRPARKGAVTIVFEGVPPGIYAIGAFHDENANGKLDQNFIGFPEEGYALSNDIRLSMYRPRFAESAFTVGEADLQVTLHVNY